MSFLVPAIFMRETMPLLGQAVNTIIPAILPWAAWPIRGNCVPHENGRKLRKTFLFMDELGYSELFFQQCNSGIFWLVPEFE